MQILNNIQKIRWERNLSLRELSKLSGISHTEISMLENGMRIPSQIVMLKISRGLNMDVAKVFNLSWQEINLDNF